MRVVTSSIKIRIDKKNMDCISLLPRRAFIPLHVKYVVVAAMIIMILCRSVKRCRQQTVSQQLDSGFILWRIARSRTALPAILLPPLPPNKLADGTRIKTASAAIYLATHCASHKETQRSRDVDIRERQRNGERERERERERGGEMHTECRR